MPSAPQQPGTPLNSDTTTHPVPSIAEVSLRRRLKNQRRELRRLNRALQRAKQGFYVKTVREDFLSIRQATAAMTNLTGNAPWNAGVHHGMKMARSIIARLVPAEVVERLSHAIAWRFEGAERRTDAD